MNTNMLLLKHHILNMTAWQQLRKQDEKEKVGEEWTK